MILTRLYIPFKENERNEEARSREDQNELHLGLNIQAATLATWQFLWHLTH